MGPPLDGYVAWLEAARDALPDEQEHLLDWIWSFRRPAFTPQTSTPDEDDECGSLAPTASKLGGLPYLHPSEEWPCDEGGPLTPIWQLRVAELPVPVQRTLGATDGLLQFFLSADWNRYDDWFLVRLLAPEELVPLPAGAAEAPTRYRYPVPVTAVLDEQVAVVGWDEHDDWPVAYDLVAWRPEAVDEQRMEEVVGRLQALDIIRCTGGDKLLGWPHWCESNEWFTTSGQRGASAPGQRYLQLIQLEGHQVPITVGDMGTLVVQGHPRDPLDCEATYNWL